MIQNSNENPLGDSFCLGGLMIKELKRQDRYLLKALFKDCVYDRVLIDSVLEGNFGTSHALYDGGEIIAARLDSGAFTMISGQVSQEELKDFLEVKPIYIVTPQTTKWDMILSEYFKDKGFKIPFTRFDSSCLDIKLLNQIVDTLDNSYSIKTFDHDLAEQAIVDLGNEYLFENFHNIEDFLSRGLGYALLDGNKVICAATSMAISKTAIDIEIQTHQAYRRQGLASITGSLLLIGCLEKGLNPIWLAANPASEKLALKLGYKRIDQYESLCIE